MKLLRDAGELSADERDAFMLSPPGDSEVVMAQFVVYKHPKDAPDDWVVRRWHICRTEPAVRPENGYRFRSLEDARTIIPRWAMMLTPGPADDPAIFEVWI